MPSGRRADVIAVIGMAVVQPVRWVDVFRQDVVPVLTGYAVFLATLLAYGSARRAGHATSKWPTRANRLRPELADGRAYLSSAFVRYLAWIVLGGYAFFLAVVMVFYFVIGERSRTFISQALGQGSLLAFAIVLPGFAVLSCLEEGARRFFRWRRRGRSSR
jgi:Family of unknown function (DUF6256)